jgi:sporulation protein YlmC with PRC-barrel domain
MALVKITDFDPSYPNTVGDKDLINYSVYSDVTNEKIGTIEDILVDEDNGHFRYFVVDIGSWIFGKKILLPVEYCQIKFDIQQVYAQEMTKEQAENLSEFNSSLRVDQEYEDQISAIYPPRSMNSLNTTGPLGNPVSPVVPYSPITIGTLATLTSPSAPPYIGTPPTVAPEHDRDLQ